MPSFGCRLMQGCLPPVQDLELNDLPALAQLHMSSAANMMKTLRLLTPGVFTDDSDRPNEALFLQLEGEQLDVVTMLIDLQLFHMTRAAALVAAAKERLRNRGNTDTKGCYGGPAGPPAA